MKTLPKADPKVIWNWGVCRAYRDPTHLATVTGRRSSLDAQDVLHLPIRTVDKLWVNLRQEMLPREVLERVCDRIVVILPANAGDIPHPRARERRQLVDVCREAGDFWGVSRHTTAVLDLLGLSAADDERARQLAILQEEIDRWQNEK